MTKEIATGEVKGRENESKIVVGCARAILRRIAAKWRAENKRIKTNEDNMKYPYIHEPLLFWGNEMM